MSQTPTTRSIFRDGLWGNNAALVQLLGLCPLLAVTTTAVAGLGLGIATLLVVTASSVVVSLIRNIVPQDVRIPVFILVIAAFVTIVELVVAAWLHDLYRTLGLFLPLIVTNCAILARAEAFASRQPVGPAALDGIATGTGFAAVLIVLGALRELIGRGTLLDGAEQLFGPAAAGWTVELVDGDVFLLAILPPGAFIGLALLLAIKNRIDDRHGR
ncbi:MULTISPECIES: electron transport complex subunit E [unclassified Halorhodospira]|uniref:electron transport complex subunit E n=1 Tax=unclassified Halorhodospira TaxID=2626748 RepID=UPI001EE8E16D|nr:MULTISPECIES: electron transport complex subunit E [unclassified Halorhodospira]MCG5541393.1 electron transport complex subunit E [Halorhodospira sp. M39old]MCG5546387.1 electron transport complex subunit E [Halorhodospira sp. M38]